MSDDLSTLGSEADLISVYELPAGLSPGALLRNARLARDLSLVDVQEQTRIAATKLECIERDDFDAVGDEVYICGYLRSYGRFLNLDASKLVLLYQQNHRSNSADRAAEMSAVRESGRSMAKASAVAGRSSFNFHSKMSWPKYALVTVFVFLLGAVGYGVLRGPASSDEASEPVSEQKTMISTPLATRASEESPVLLAVSASEKDEENTVEYSEEPAQLDSSEATVFSASVPLIGEARLTLSFTDDCWVDIKDKNSQVLFAELQHSGDNLQLFGEAPFDVMLGNARAVSMSINGQPVNLTLGPNRKSLRLSVSAP